MTEQTTRERAIIETADWARDPATVSEVLHAGFNGDAEDGGLAFACDRGFVVFAYDGRTVWSIDPGGKRDREAAIESFWYENQHRNRTVSLDDLNAWLRAAVAALVAGVTSVGDLPESQRLDVTDVARADYIFVVLRRNARPTREDALRALAANDWIMEMDAVGDIAHPCPVCRRPAIGRAWHYLTICDADYAKALCRDGRRVTGHNTSFGGGFEASHVDDETVCDQVTQDGTVWIDGVECHMGEAKFGGVFVGISPG